MPESMAQDFGFTGALEKRAHSELRNCFASAVVESKDKSYSGIIEFSLLKLYPAKFCPANSQLTNSQKAAK